jgi:hypothetical protein
MFNIFGSKKKKEEVKLETPRTDLTETQAKVKQNLIKANRSSYRNKRKAKPSRSGIAFSTRSLQKHKQWQRTRSDEKACHRLTKTQEDVRSAAAKHGNDAI